MMSRLPVQTITLRSGVTGRKIAAVNFEGDRRERRQHWSTLCSLRHAPSSCGTKEVLVSRFGARERAVYPRPRKAGKADLVAVCVRQIAFGAGRAGYPLRPLAVVWLLGHASGKSSCCRVGARRVTERW